jgi:hypothetical protein
VRDSFDHQIDILLIRGEKFQEGKGFSPDDARVYFIYVTQAGFVLIRAIENVQGHFNNLVLTEDKGFLLPTSLHLRFIIIK